MSHQGFTYHFKHKRNGVVIDEFDAENLIPTEGQEYILGAALLSSVTKISNWYAGLFTGSYVPTEAVAASTLQSLTTEFTAYVDTNRPDFAPSVVTGGEASDAHAYVFNGDGTVNGAFVSSSATKNGSDGVLISVVRFTSPRTVLTGDVLEVTNKVGL